MINRRKFLAGSTVVSGAVLGMPHLSRSAEVLHQTNGQRPRHIIHMVADGTALSTLTCGDHLSRTVRRHGLTWMDLMKRPAARNGLMNMRSLNSLVTDSSAASSSWGSGSRIINGAVNQLPNGTPLTPLYTLFAEKGWKRGLVTTTEITHATPAGFAASVDERDTGSLIATQYLDRKIDVLLGGGSKFFDPKTRRDKRDLYADYAAAGYTVMKKAEDLSLAGLDRRWLGTFAVSHLPFSLDRAADPKLIERVPTLATMTQRALSWLQRHEHFILQVEGGRVDHGCHNNDVAAALRDLIAFDEAVDVALEFQSQHPDTLVIVTTDHATGGLALNGMGDAYGQSLWLFENVAKLKCSFPEILRQLRHKPLAEVAAEEAKVGGTDPKEEEKKKAAAPKPATDSVKEKDAPLATGMAAVTNAVASTNAVAAAKPKEYIPSAKEIIDIVYANTGYKPSSRRAELLVPFLAKKGAPLFDAMNSDTAQLGQLLGNHLGIGWTGTAHTGDYVPIVAMGPGAERFAGFIQNTDVFRHYTQLAGIDFQNPREDDIAATRIPSPERIDEYAEVMV